MYSVLRATLLTLSATVLCTSLFASPLPQAEMARRADRFNQRMQLGQPYDAATQQFLHSAASLSSAIFLRQAAEATPYFVDWMSGTRKVAGDNPGQPTTPPCLTAAATMSSAATLALPTMWVFRSMPCTMAVTSPGQSRTGRPRICRSTGRATLACA
ncbi:hypothetical protein O0544_22015 [Edwardsiella anguillarum]|nr:hypothetical protein [Edwardsiella anguillarum]